MKIDEGKRVRARKTKEEVAKLLRVDPDDFAEEVGRALKEARENISQRHWGKKDLTQTEAAELIGLNPTQLAHYESGRRVPTLLVFHGLCELYEIEPQEVLCLKNVEKKGKRRNPELCEEKMDVPIESRGSNESSSVLC